MMQDPATKQADDTSLVRKDINPKKKGSATGQFAQKSAVYIVGNLLEKASLLLLIPLFTRMMSTEEYGFYGAAVALCGVVIPLVDLGLSASLARFIHDYFDDKARLLGYLKSSFWLRIYSSLVSSLFCGIILYVSWNWLFAENPVGKGIVLWIVLFALGTTLVNFACSYFRTTYQAFNFAICRIGQTFLQFAFVLYVLFNVESSAEAILNAQAVGAISAGLLVMGIFYFKNFFRVSDMKLSPLDAKDNLRFGVPLIPHQLGNWLRSASDRVILGRFVSLSNVGLYQLSVNIGNVMSIFVSCIDMAYSPLFYRTRKVKGKDAVFMYRSFNNCYLIIMGILTLSVALFAREIVFLLAPEDYAQAALITPLIVYAIYFQGQYTLVIKPLFFHKKTKIVPVLTLFPGLAGVAANIILLPVFGFMTVVWVNLLVYFITFIVVYVRSNSIEDSGYPIKLGFLTNTLVGVLCIYLTYNTFVPWEINSLVLRIIFIMGLTMLGWFYVIKKEIPFLKENLQFR
ncbi:oligosaccharide flippase family protein [Cytophagaceae bacterium ABcell3]|nr:oligosaccharide flippase family protein [Cytophagaceae bacterium ABcell3]